MIRFLQNPNTGRRFITGFIVATLVVAMTLYLGNFFTGGSSVTTAGVFAEVGDEKITVQQVSDNARRMGQRTFPNGIPEFVMPELNRRASDNLVVQAALVTEATRMGLKVTDDELVHELSQGDFGKELFPNGSPLTPDQYKAFVQNRFNMTTTNFEKVMKSDLVIRKLIGVIQGGVAVPDSEVTKEFQRQNVKVKFDYAVVTAADLMKKVTVTESELHAYFDRNKSTFAVPIPEQRKARYVVIDSSSVPVQVSSDEIKKLYDQRQDTYREPEQADVRHILVKTKEEALDVKKKLESGAKFDDLAKKLSQDPGSKDNGGLYKGVVRGQMVAEFDKVAFSQPKGKISDPVQTSFGFHVIRVDDRREARIKPLEQVKSELELAIKTEKSAAQVDTLSNTVYSEARTEGLEKAATKHGLKVVNTDFFAQTASLPGVGSSQQFMQGIFGMTPKSPAERIQLSQGFAIAEVTDIKKSSSTSPTFETARKSAESQLRNERATGMLASKTKELGDRAHALNNLKQAAKELGFEVKTSTLLGPSDQLEGVGAMSGPASMIFDLKAGQISEPLMSGRNGVVMALLQRQEPSADDLVKQKDGIRDQILQRKRLQLLEMYADTLRTRMIKDGDIKINAQEEDRLLKRQGN